MREHRKRSALPIYIFGGVWLVIALFFPLYRLWQLTGALVLSLAAAFLAKALMKKRGKYETVTYEPLPEPEPEPEPEKSYGSEIDALISEGKTAEAEMKRLRFSIAEPGMKQRIDRLIDISGKIVEDALHDPSDVPRIKTFLSYYLPTTIKLLNAYDRMSAQGIEGENIGSSTRRIEDMLDTAIAAYEKQLDSLFANQALDIETDIAVMNAMLAREGLSGSDFDLKK